MHNSSFLCHGQRRAVVGQVSHSPQLYGGKVGRAHAVGALVLRTPALRTKAKMAARVLDLETVSARPLSKASVLPECSHT